MDSTPPGTEAGRLLIISSSRLYLDGLVALLDETVAVTVVATSLSVSDGIEQINRLKPGIVLLDLTTLECTEVVDELAECCEDTKIVVLNVPEDELCIHSCAQAGVAGYIALQDSSRDLLTAVKNVLQGKLHCPGHIASFLFRMVESRAKDKTRSRSGNSSTLADMQLTRREKQIATMLSNGLSNKQIAARLDIGESTVKSHVHNILVKVGAHNRTHAVSLLREVTGIS